MNSSAKAFLQENNSGLRNFTGLLAHKEFL